MLKIPLDPPLSKGSSCVKQNPLRIRRFADSPISPLWKRGEREICAWPISWRIDEPRTVVKKNLTDALDSPIFRPDCKADSNPVKLPYPKTFAFILVAALAMVNAQRHTLAADKIRVAFSAISPTQGVLWVADVGGFLSKNGFAADIVYTRAAIETLVAGEVQFGQMTGSLMFSARLQGADPVMIAGVQDILNDRLIVRPNIHSVEDLKGRRVAVFRFGSASHMRLLNVLPRYGMNERDVTFLQVGDAPERLMAISGGSVDATLLSPPEHFEAQRLGMKILLNLRDLNVPYQGSGLVVTQRLIARNRDMVKRFLKAYVEAIHAVRTNPALSKRAFAKYRQTRDEKHLEDAYQTLREVVKPKPYPSIDGFKTIIQDAVGRVPAARNANPRDFMDTSLLEELDRSGYIDALYR